ncbi:hypothetical protein HPP92_001080 [Vanilla planifolia]|uniref:Pentatricopeptide repeat-containing protein n=1 Tax=Vanilla planifolia TaxID=51239 RepID=A0A835VL79_VANPL|nr:hypothetical protein HPP92_001080 [Vanilla planifolia]
MAEWMREGRRVTETELINFVRQFRRHKSYKVALELMEWMNGSGGIKLSSSSHAVHLDLITKFKGIDEAEKYFDNLTIFNQNHQTYGALLSGYCQEMMADKAIALYEKMQKLNFSHNTLTYNNLMMLYLKLGNAEKAPSLLQEMKAENISPDTFTYCLMMKSYATLNDIDSVERVVKEIEVDAKGSVSWFLYSNLASIFIEAGLVEKTKSALEKLEAVMDHHNRECYHYLISMHTGVGNLTRSH